MRYESHKVRFSAVCLIALVAATALSRRPAVGQERVFVTDGNQTGDTLFVLDTSAMPTPTPIGVGLQPSNVAVRPDGAFAYVTNSFDGTVSVVNTAINAAIATITIGSITETDRNDVKKKKKKK